MTAARIKEQLKSKIGFSKIGNHGFEANSLSKLRDVSKSVTNLFLQILESRLNGLSENEVEEKRNQFGSNEIEHEKAAPWYKQLVRSFLTPFNGVLITIAIVSYVIDILFKAPGEHDYKTVIVVGAMILLSSIIRFWQEYSSNQAAEKLKGMVSTTATLIRKETGKKEFDIKEIVLEKRRVNSSELDQQVDIPAMPIPLLN